MVPPCYTFACLILINYASDGVDDPFEWSQMGNFVTRNSFRIQSNVLLCYYLVHLNRIERIFE